jgi:uncharacterized protein YjbI with pentapeptide repeats
MARDIVLELANLIRANDPKGYIKLKYSIYDEGDVIDFRDEDFSGIDMTKFPLPFVVFINCNLRGAIIDQFPIGMRDCNVTALDLRGQRTIITAQDCDFSGMLYDDETLLRSNMEPNSGISKFSRCKFDSKTKEHFLAQGSIFTDENVDYYSCM